MKQSAIESTMKFYRVEIMDKETSKWEKSFCYTTLAAAKAELQRAEQGYLYAARIVKYVGEIVA